MRADAAVPESLERKRQMGDIRRLCVYCGSAGMVDEGYRAAASELGTRLAAAGIELVYGGGRVGLMGLLADAALASGGGVTGIIPVRLAEAAGMDVSAYMVAAAVAQMARDDAATAAFAALDALNQTALEEAANIAEADLPSFASLTAEEQFLVRRVLGSALGSDDSGVA